MICCKRVTNAGSICVSETLLVLGRTSLQRISRLFLFYGRWVEPTGNLTMDRKESLLKNASPVRTLESSYFIKNMFVLRVNTLYILAFAHLLMMTLIVPIGKGWRRKQQ